MTNTVNFFNCGELAPRISTAVVNPKMNERDGLLQNFIVTHVDLFICSIGRPLVPFFIPSRYISNVYVFSCIVYQKVQYLTSAIHFWALQWSKVLSLCTPRRNMAAFGEVDNSFSIILGTRWRWMVRFTPWHCIAAKRVRGTPPVGGFVYVNTKLNSQRSL